MLTQTSAGGGASRAHSRESSAHPSPARHEGTLSPHVLTQSQSPAPLVTPSQFQPLDFTSSWRMSPKLTPSPPPFDSHDQSSFEGAKSSRTSPLLPPPSPAQTRTICS